VLAVTEDHRLERREVQYRGWVQGVGFRYTAQRIARQYAVTGFVRNLANGRVQLVAEGLPEELDRCLGQLARTMENYIESADVQSAPATGEFTGFDIRY
jgi:acylphosphatase